MRLGGRTQPRALPRTMGHQVTHTEDAAMVAAEAMEPAALTTAVPHQAIRALPRMLQTGVDGAREVILVARTAAG